MRNFARIENGKVVEVFDLDAHHPDAPGIEGLFHPSIKWVACSPTTKEGDVLMNGAVVAQTNYIAQRAATPAYQNHTEQLGALVKAVQALSAGQPIPPDAVAVMDSIAAVKLAIPKV